MNEELLYQQECQKHFHPSIIAFKISDMSWKDFYNRVNALYRAKHDLNLIYELSKNGQLMELKILDAFGIFNEIFQAHKQAMRNMYTFDDFKGANIAAMNSHIDLLNWYESKGILPTYNGTSDLFLHYLDRNQNAIEWLRKRGINAPSLY